MNRSSGQWQDNSHFLFNKPDLRENKFLNKKIDFCKSREHNFPPNSSHYNLNVLKWLSINQNHKLDFRNFLKGSRQLKLEQRIHCWCKRIWCVTLLQKQASAGLKNGWELLDKITPRWVDYGTPLDHNSISGLPTWLVAKTVFGLLHHMNWRDNSIKQLYLAFINNHCLKHIWQETDMWLQIWSKRQHTNQHEI